MSTSPLSGIVVLDCSRLLPGAVLARTLLDLGARLIKIEEPTVGDPMRHTPPLVDGVGAAFGAFLGGAESVTLDLKSERGATALRKLSKHADVLVENFRPGTLEKWGLGPERLRAGNPALTICSISSFGRTGPWADKVAHDMNLTAAAGLYDMMSPAEGIPRLQVADVTAALLASSAIVAALFERTRTGLGAVIDQPLVSGVVPPLTWAWADAAAGGGGLVDTTLAGRCPAYRTYRGSDGKAFALGAIEPKFWTEFVEMLELPQLVDGGLDPGERGAAIVAEVTKALEARPRDEWVTMALDRGLPVTPVQTVDEALESGFLQETGLAAEAEPGAVPLPGPYVPSVGQLRGRPPRHGEHTSAVLAEHGLPEGEE